MESINLEKTNLPEAIKNAIYAASSKEGEFTKNGNQLSLKEAITQWTFILEHDFFEHIPIEIKANILNDTSSSYLRYFWVSYDSNFLNYSIELLNKASSLLENDKTNTTLPIVFANLGNCLTERFSLNNSIKDLELGIDSYQKSVTLQPSNPVFLCNLAIGLHTRYVYLGDFDNLDNSIDLLEKAETLLPDRSPYTSYIYSNLATALREKYLKRGGLNTLNMVIDKYKNALKYISPENPEASKFLNNLGISLRDRYSAIGKKDDILEAIFCCQTSVKLTPKSSSALPVRIINLATCIEDRYKRNGSLADLDNSILLYRKAIELTRQDSPDIPGYLNNLGISLVQKYTHTEKLNYIEEGINCYNKALSAISEKSPDKPGILNNLSTALSRLYTKNKNEKHLLNALKASKEAVYLTDSNSISYNIYATNLANLLLDLFKIEAIKSLANKSPVIPKLLDESIDIYAEITRKSQRNMPNMSGYVRNLAISVYDRFIYFRNTEDINLSNRLFRISAKLGLRSSSKEALIGANHWLLRAFDREDWLVIIHSYKYAVSAIQLLLKKQVLRSHKEAWLKDTQGITTKAAYAFAKLDKLKEATATLEQGQARLLSESLAIIRANLTALQNTEHARLYDAYQETTQRWNWAQEHKPGKLKSIREQLDGIIEQIRQLPGYAEFLKPSGWADIELAAADTSLLYVLATEHGGLALLVQRADEAFTSTSSVNGLVEVQPLWLPDFTETALQEMLESYLPVYRVWQDAGSKIVGNEFDAWCEVLDKTTRRLWDCIFAPLQNSLPQELVLIPAGLLNLLPLHAAWTTDDSGGRRYALDCWRIRYAPNARSLHTARALREQTADKSLLAVENPKSDIAYAAHATQSLQRYYPQAAVYNHGQAAHDKVFDALPNYDILHFYCHGKTDTEQPLQSRLALADDNLSLQTLLEKGRLKARLALLCACETGVPGTKLPDEVVSLATGLLQAGVAGVVSSLWSVADFTTMLLINRFYQLWREDCPDNPAEALHRAQQWIRDSSLADFRAYFQAQMQQDPIAAELYRHFSHDPRYAFADPQQRPFAHPYHWAAFGYVGV